MGRVGSQFFSESYHSIASSRKNLGYGRRLFDDFSRNFVESATANEGFAMR